MWDPRNCSLLSNLLLAWLLHSLGWPEHRLPMPLIWVPTGSMNILDLEFLSGRAWVVSLGFHIHRSVTDNLLHIQMFSVINSAYSLYCITILYIQVQRTTDISTILSVVRCSRLCLYRKVLLSTNNMEFFLCWDTQCHLFCSPVLLGIYLIMWHRLNQD